jgi:DNA primase
MADVFDPRHWEERAAKTRDKADQFNMRASRDRLLKIAEEYDRIAQQAAERQQAST